MPEMTDRQMGLSSAEAARRLKISGPNELPAAGRRSLWGMAWVVLKEPMFILLMSCGGIYLLLGSKEDAFILLGSVVIIMAMSLSQERKSARALEALRELAGPQVRVLRDGEQKQLAGRLLVPGDIIFLAEGGRIPADAVLFYGQNMTVDESSLSGESIPVRKQDAEQIPDIFAPPGGDDQPFLYSGTLIVQGIGRAEVIATGADTALGRIGQALLTLKEESSQVQLETAHLVKVVAASSMVLVIILAVWYGLDRGDWLNGILAGLTLAMSILPAELPLILTIFLGLGAWRMARRKVLTRRLAAIEMLGAATVLCTDKTGTLTQNRMEVAQISVDTEAHSFRDTAALQPHNFPEPFHAVLEFAMLSSHRDPFDPMEKAIQQTGNLALAGTEHIHQGWQLVEEYPLSAELLAMSRVWRSPDSEHYVIAAKGAPEAIIDLCHLPAGRAAEITDQVNQQAAQGLRVLAVARASFRTQDLPAIQHDFEFRYIGLIALADPLRPAVREAVKQCHEAGIRVMMITGDYPATALNIATQGGLDVRGGIMTGADLDRLNEVQLQRRLPQVNVFCRVQPEQKLRLVEALKRSGEVVAMTGDGVNDAPALKCAHIGIAMGGRGTDVARESAALVLLDDDFNSIVAAVGLGRRIVDNMRKAVVFIVAAHIPIAGMSMLPVMLGWPLVLLPVHIVFFELMVDPVCAVVFEAEAEEINVMKRPPRPASSKIFDSSLLLLGAQQGSVLLLLLLAVYSGASWAGLATEQARALTFSAMILGDIWLIFINRCWSLPLRFSLKRPNPALWWIVSGALLMLALALLVPGIREVFHFAALSLAQFALMALLACTALLLMTLLTKKWVRH